MKPILLVVAPTGFRDEELFETRAILEKAGRKTVIASLRPVVCEGTQGGTVLATETLEKTRVSDYSAIVFVGGPGSKVYFNHEHAHRLARQMNEEDKIVAAICIAPVILAHAGILKDRRVTAFHSEVDEIRKAGAIYTGDAVTVDDNIITADGPGSAVAFGKAIEKELPEHRNAMAGL